MIGPAAGYHQKEDGYFVSKSGTHVFIINNKMAKHPQTGTPLINPNTDKAMIPDLVIVTKQTITVIDHVYKGSELHLKKTEGYIKALKEAWPNVPLAVIKLHRVIGPWSRLLNSSRELSESPLGP